MLKLKNISKFYHQNGNVGIGINKISLEFKLGEFAIITGESGSGKSTLLNVLSGIDTYEEGEFTIDGVETSGFCSEEWENYRNNYIGFVFQNYNLIDTYTVLQNVEIAMTLSNYDPKEKRKRALELIEHVGLTSHKNHKAAKLSGGQKQRAVIARALAKDTPIIVADEPTGNLDSASSAEIIKLLKEISKDKLVLMVTHNPEEALHCATRNIRLFDGKVIEDTALNPPLPSNEKINFNFEESAKLSFWTTFKIALSNILSIPKKSTLSFLVFLVFISGFIYCFSAITIAIPEFAEADFLNWRTGNFADLSNRLIITKDNGDPFTQSEIDSFSKKSKVNNIIKESYLLDFPFDIEKDSGDFYSNSSFSNLTIYPLSQFELLDEKLNHGTLPNVHNEAILSLGTYEYDNFFDPDSDLDTTYNLKPRNKNHYSNYSYSYDLPTDIIESFDQKSNFYTSNLTEIKLTGTYKSNAYDHCLFVSDELYTELYESTKHNFFDTIVSFGDHLVDDANFTFAILPDIKNYTLNNNQAIIFFYCLKRN